MGRIVSYSLLSEPGYDYLSPSNESHSTEWPQNSSGTKSKKSGSITLLRKHAYYCFSQGICEYLVGNPVTHTQLFEDSHRK